MRRDNMKVNGIIASAKTCKKNVEKLQKIGVNQNSAYYYCKVILGAKDDVKEITIKAPSTTTGDYISRQISKDDYIDMAKRLVAYVEKNKRMPNYITYKTFKVGHDVYTHLFAIALVTSIETGYLPKKVNVNSKAFVKKTETGNVVYDYFVKTFGSFGDTIDEALGKIAGCGYGYYYDDKYSNKESINRMKNRQGVNCTDSSSVFWNIGKALGYEVRAVHVKCRGGDGHIRLQFKHKKHTSNQWINRDPAAVLSNGNIRSVWCLDGTILAYDPQWFLQNVNR